ncbi:Fasciclin-like arabinogalactan protein [Actinidia chinensis var. chinensis]|uniref:Fasciclin-like arabinogalactan protein n=1 Tax=Actinidia chinensis var. chinensis TaxID=1590841 RepID=A0A2R6PYH1_ACTCC|nr:Fasciclin-like arabinogalactan protein [Actinidia chinensis var. chinensis]
MLPSMEAKLSLLLLLFLVPGRLSATLGDRQTQINSNSVLVALLDSRYTELAELVEKALLLQTLEEAVSKHEITIFAPQNEALERDLDPEFKRFLLEPRNLKSLQTLLLHHIVPRKIAWPESDSGSLIESTHSDSVVSGPNDVVRRDGVIHGIDSDSPTESTHPASVRVLRPNDVVRPDGIIHGIERLIVPRSVQLDFNRRRSLRSISAVKPEGAPEVDPRTHRLKTPSQPVAAGAPPALPIYDAMAPGPSLAPAPAPGPGGPRGHFDGEAQVKDFIHTLLHYGGYSEMADILVNLTNLATEMGRLVSEGYVLTVLAPNDEAMAKLSIEKIGELGSIDAIMYYHIVPEYQTEESMYNAVRRFGTVNYDTLRLPHKVVAREADGSVKFGHGDESAYLFDPDIYTDGRISVQGIDGVLFPAAEEKTVAARIVKVVAKPRRGKLLEVACRVLGVIGQDSRFTTCQ